MRMGTLLALALPARLRSPSLRNPRREFCAPPLFSAALIPVFKYLRINLFDARSVAGLMHE